MAQETTKYLSPEYLIKVNGAALQPAERAYVNSVYYTDDVFGLSMVELKVNIWDTDKNEFTMIDKGPFSLGAKVSLSLGYTGNLVEMMSGEIISIIPRFCTNGTRAMTVRIYDKGHRLTQGKKVRNFIGLKDSEIVEKIVREAGLRSNVTDTGTVIPQVIQNNITDMEFIRGRARRYGYLAYTSGDIFNFVNNNFDSASIATLNYGVDFTDFIPKLSLSEPVSEVEVRGWDNSMKQGISGRAQKGTEKTKMKGKNSGSEVSTKIFGMQKIIVTNVNVYNSSQSEMYAKAELLNHSMGLIEGKMGITGNNQIKAGSVIQLKGLTQSFNGNYYVNSSTHTIDANGYNTQLFLRRDGV